MQHYKIVTSRIRNSRFCSTSSAGNFDRHLRSCIGSQVIFSPTSSTTTTTSSNDESTTTPLVFHDSDRTTTNHCNLAHLQSDRNFSIASQPCQTMLKTSNNNDIEYDDETTASNTRISSLFAMQEEGKDKQFEYELNSNNNTNSKSTTTAGAPYFANDGVSVMNQFATWLRQYQWKEATASEGNVLLQQSIRNYTQSFTTSNSSPIIAKPTSEEFALVMAALLKDSRIESVIQLWEQLQTLYHNDGAKQDTDFFPTQLCYNSILCALAKQSPRSNPNAAQTAHRILLDHPSPSLLNINAVLLCYSKLINEAAVAAKDSSSEEWSPDDSSSDALISAEDMTAIINNAETLLQSISTIKLNDNQHMEPNLFSYQAMLRILKGYCIQCSNNDPNLRTKEEEVNNYSSYGPYYRAQGLIKKMKQQGLFPNKDCYVSELIIMDNLSMSGEKMQKILEEQMIPQQLKQRKQQQQQQEQLIIEQKQADEVLLIDHDVYRLILDAYRRDGMGALAESFLFDHILSKNCTVTTTADSRQMKKYYNLVLESYSRTSTQSGSISNDALLSAAYRAESLLRKMQQLSEESSSTMMEEELEELLEPDSSSYYYVMKCWYKSKHRESVNSNFMLLQEMIEKCTINPNLKPTLPIFTIMVETVYETNQVSDRKSCIKKIINIMKDHNIHPSSHIEDIYMQL